MAIRKPRGTQDFLPEQMINWHYIEQRMREICKVYGFNEIRTPAFEDTKLFLRGIGETTDVVQKEMYTFEDLGHRSITLKPEGTSPAVRAFIESHDYAEMQPTKYYYNTPCFRYERPQAGRLREFHQFGVESFGTPDMMADAEVIALASDFLTKVGIEDIELRINSVGCRECRPVYRKALQDYLQPYYGELSETSKTRFESNPMRIIDSKDPHDQEIAQAAPDMLDYLCDDCRAAFKELKSNLDAMGIRYTIDPGIVRGLDYYTKTAFEFVTTGIGAQDTVCGGGRYDHLVEEIGGPSIPGVGFGLGKERLIILMEQKESLIEDNNAPDIAVSFIGDKARLYALGLVHELRQQGVAAIIDTLNRNLKGQMKYANKLKAGYSVVIGDDEIEHGVVTLKDMKSGEQKQINSKDITKEITK